MNRSILAALALMAVASAEAKELGFDCQGIGRDGHVWRYFFTIDQTSGKGVEKGTTFGGDPFVRDVTVVLTPERMQIRHLNESNYIGSIDRRDLAFDFGGAQGKCEMVQIKPEKKKF